ncbi:hypothetical protein [Jiangella gansuensis]|uniref:hypothetical protein n=1 Tax=Jiangella gansuensis TaxID=281473 RepID=UPI000479683B|nr:hypothetical protein [Jiangella gansuensis]
MEAGAKLLGVELHDHQLELGELLDAGHETTAIQWPRRAGKTTSIWAWLLGRCATEDDTLILTTAQSGFKARDRFMSIMRMLDRAKAPGRPRVYQGAGHEAFEFANHSRLWVVAPKADTALGDAANVIYVDEAQALAPDASLDFEQAAMPLLDTVEDGQVVLSGTPGKVRAGWYWNALQTGLGERTGVVVGSYAPGHAVSVYAAQPGDKWDDERVWRRIHPGIGRLTTIEKIRARHTKFAKEPLRFAMEYLGVWPGTDQRRAIDADEWAAAGDDFAEKPDRFGLAYDVDPLGVQASLVAAWRDDDGLAHIELLMHGEPRQIGKEALRVAREHRVPIGYDNLGQNLDVAEGLNRAKPKPKMMPLALRDIVAAQSGLMAELRITEKHPAVTLQHPDQPVLNAAVESAAWRTVGDSGQLFGRRVSTGDITAIVAAANALLVFDRMPKRTSIRIVTRAS